MVKSAEELAKSARKRQRKQNDYINRRYDRVSVVLPRGFKQLITASGESINAFITSAVTTELERRGLLTVAPPAPPAPTFEDVPADVAETPTACPF